MDLRHRVYTACAGYVPPNIRRPKIPYTVVTPRPAISSQYQQQQVPPSPWSSTGGYVPPSPSGQFYGSNANVPSAQAYQPPPPPPSGSAQMQQGQAVTGMCIEVGRREVRGSLGFRCRYEDVARSLSVVFFGWNQLSDIVRGNATIGLFGSGARCGSNNGAIPATPATAAAISEFRGLDSSVSTATAASAAAAYDHAAVATSAADGTTPELLELEFVWTVGCLSDQSGVAYR